MPPLTAWQYAQAADQRFSPHTVTRALEILDVYNLPFLHYSNCVYDRFLVAALFAVQVPSDGQHGRVDVGARGAAIRSANPRRV